MAGRKEEAGNACVSPTPQPICSSCHQPDLCSSVVSLIASLPMSDSSTIQRRENAWSDRPHQNKPDIWNLFKTTAVPPISVEEEGWRGCAAAKSELAESMYLVPRMHSSRGSNALYRPLQTPTRRHVTYNNKKINPKRGKKGAN